MTTQMLVDLGGLLPLGEKRKVLNQFIRQSNENEVDTILNDCKGLPSTQYNLLQLLLADKFHRFDLIIALLYKGDSDIISGALSKRWLYEGENNSLADCEFLFNELFPKVSYNCRRRVLHKIGRYVQNENRVNEIWNRVEQRYGYDAAFPLLQSCSKAKINSVITNKQVKLSSYQLVQILQKYPDIALEYIKNNGVYARSSSTNLNCSPLNYIYKNHPEDFLDLCINHSDKVEGFELGRVRSTKMIRSYRAKLMEHPDKTSSLLKFDRIRREFSSKEFQTLFESSMPKVSRNVTCNDMWKWVSTAPINKRLEMTNQAFMKLYKVNLEERPDLMNPDYIMLLPHEKRINSIQWKIKNSNDYSWTFKGISVYRYSDERERALLMLKPTTHSVPELQKLLLIEQDVNMRAKLSKYLIQTCYFNEDLPQLLHVLTLLSKRSRNDQAEVRIEIFRTLCNIMDKMEFTKEHWDIIIEMIQVALVFKATRDYSDSEKEQLVSKCLAFHLASKMPLDNLVSMHIKLNIQVSASCWINKHIKNPTDARTLLQLYAKEIENLQQANNLCSYNGTALNTEQLKEFIIKFIEEICSFNESQGADLEPIEISSHQWLWNSFEQIAKDEEARINKHFSENSYDLYFAERLIKIIKSLRMEQTLRFDAFNRLEDLNAKNLVSSPSSSILMHFLSENPSYLIQSWSTSVLQILKTDSMVEFMKKLKYWNYSTFVNETIKICNEIVSQATTKDSGVKQKCNAVLVLSVLREPLEFLALVSEYYPTESKVDVFAENSDEDYKIRQTFAKSLVNVTTPHLTFPAIEKFFVGDYLKLAIGALYSQINRASEIDALNFLHQKLVNVGVSLQKHIIRLFLNISSVDDKIRVFNEIESNNVSIRCEIFVQAVKLFRSSPSEGTWMILKTCIEKTSTDDVNIVKYLHLTPMVDTCPVEYIANYVDTCIALLRKLEPEKVDDFLKHLDNIIHKIPEKTLDDLILYKHVDQVSFNSRFCENYLHSCTSTSTLEHRLSNMWCVLQNVIRNGWGKRKYIEYPTRTLVLSFISNLCLNEMNTSKLRLKRQILNTLLAKFKAESVTKFFKEFLYLELTLLLIEVIEGDKVLDAIERLKSFGRSLARFLDSLAETYGGEIIWLIQDTVKHYVKICFCAELNNDKGVIVELIAGILEISKTRQNRIISMNLLQDVTLEQNSNLLSTSEKIKGILNEPNDVIAQLYGLYVNLN